MMEPKITAELGSIVPWYGGKRMMAALIIAEIGRHKAYWEVFGGSFAVLMAKPACQYETVNDAHGDVINLARVIQDPDAAAELYGRLARVLSHETLCREAAARLDCKAPPQPAGDLDLDRAADFMVCAWQSRNGALGRTGAMPAYSMRFSTDGGDSAKRWRNAVDSIPAWHERLRGVAFLNQDAFDVLGRIRDEDESAIYLDPPYIKKSGTYAYDFTPREHCTLAELAGRFKRARVVVSYYDHPVVRELYPSPRWTTVMHKRPKLLGHRKATADCDGRPELLILNGPSLAEPGLFGDFA